VKGNDWMGIIIIMGIIGVALFGGIKGSGNEGLITVQNPNPVQNQNVSQNSASLEYQIKDTEFKVEELKKLVQAEEDKKNNSKYFGMIDLRYANRATDPKQEYLTIQASYSATIPIKMTGWTLKSSSTGTTVNIPKGVYLFFTGTANYEEDIYLAKGEILYLITGISPNGVSFKVNKCSGYLNQFQTYVPYLSSNCPLPRNENLDSIPKTPNNDTCLDYIERFPMCRIQTESLPPSWSYECNNFIYNKINYPSCVDTHKNDSDFYLGEWRVYLRYSESIWKQSREEIVLYDELGKKVSTLKY